MKFEWDEDKRQANIEKHGIDFIDVCRLFESPYFVIPDSRRDYGEDRGIAFGHIRQRLMVVAFTDRKGVIRIISARKANEREKKKFEIEIAHRLEKNRRDEG